MKDTVTIVIIGKRNTGKSVLAKDIMFHKKHLPAGVVMSATEEGNAFYGTWIPDIFIYNDFDRTVIDDIMERQRKAIKAGAANNVFLLLDDCMYDKRLLKEKCMRKLFMNGRHYRMFLLLTAQYCGDLPPDIRANIDYVFVLRDNIPGNRERLYKNFFGVMPSFQSFCQLMDATTENYECLVLDNTSHSNNLEDNLYWYKAKPDHNFRMGSPSLWRFHQDNYDSSTDGAQTYGWGDGRALFPPHPPTITMPPYTEIEFPLYLKPKSEAFEDVILAVLRSLRQPPTPLNTAFFARSNVDAVHAVMQARILDGLGLRIDRQSDWELLLIMRRVYLETANNWPDDTDEEVARLNGLVLQVAIDSISRNITQFMTYRSAVPLPVPFENPANTVTSTPYPTDTPAPLVDLNTVPTVQPTLEPTYPRETRAV